MTSELREMSEMGSDGEIHDLIHCGVCLTEYDDDHHKPKFLPCSHSLCFYCVKVMLFTFNCKMIFLCNSVEYLYAGDSPPSIDSMSILS